MTNLNKHWMFNEVLKWRFVSSAFWSALSGFAVSFLLLFLWKIDTLNPLMHVFGSLASVFSARFIVVSLFFSLHAVLMSFYHLFAQNPGKKRKTTLLGCISEAFKYENVNKSLLEPLLGSSFMFLTFTFSNSSYSSLFLEDGWSLNEKHIIGLSYGFILGFFMSVTSQVCGPSKPLMMSQSAFIQRIKHKLKSLFFDSFKENYNFLLCFLISYYLVGQYFFKLVTQSLLMLPDQYQPALSIWKPLQLLTLLWALAVGGSLYIFTSKTVKLLVNFSMSRNHKFQIQTAFDDKQKMLVTSNMGKKNPKLVQQIAFSSLSQMVANSQQCRKQIFEGDSPNQGAFKVVAEECLGHMTNFSKVIGECCSQIASGSMFKKPKEKKVIVDWFVKGLSINISSLT